jgi:hypothetical protein
MDARRRESRRCTSSRENCRDTAARKLVPTPSAGVNGCCCGNCETITAAEWDRLVSPAATRRLLRWTAAGGLGRP